jgi:hypothetical protein
MGNTDGNGSITSSVLDETSIWLKITDIGPLNISEETGYTELFIWIKWTHEEGLSPSSGTLKLFSGSEDSYFESDITDLLASNEDWTNTTLKIGPDQGWASNNSPDWQSITDIEFRLVWSDSSNLTMKIDGLFFRKFVSLIESGQFVGLIIAIILQGTIYWILWSGVLLLSAKLFQEDLGQWNTVFVIFGHALIVTVVYTLASAVAISTLPALNLPRDAEAYYALLNEFWYPRLDYQLLLPLFLIGEVWIAALGAVVVRLMKETTWGKAATIAAVAFAIRFLLRLFLGF